MLWTAPTGKTVKLMVGDITRVAADAIVNAANSALVGGGGVDGAIHRAGGPSIMEELKRIRMRIGECPTGSAVETAAGELPARWIFHAVGPVYEDGQRGEPNLLASCYRKCFELAEEHDVRSISFPSISTGAYGYPLREAAGIAMREVTGQMERAEGCVRQVIFVLFDRKTYEIHAQTVAELGRRRPE